MEQVIKSGKYLFAVPMAIFGVMHFMAGDAMAGMAPFGGKFMIYFTGLAMILAAVSIFIGKFDKLACVLLGIMMLLFILPHFSNMSNAADEGAKATELISILKNIALAGGAFMCASLAKDSTYIN